MASDRELQLILTLKDRVSKSLGTVDSKLKAMSGTLKNVGAGMTVAGGAITAGFGLAVKEAATAEGALAKFETVFGDNSDAMLDFIDNLRTEMPTARQDIIAMAGGLQDLLVPLGLSRDQATGMSQDILDLSNKVAAFNDEDPTKVIEAFRSGLVGSSEPLKAYGINASVTALEAKALEEGLLQAGQSFKDLDPEVKSQVQAQALLAQATEQSSDAIEGFEENNDSFIRRMQNLNATFKEFKASIGAPLLKILDDLLKKVMPVIEAVISWSEENPKLTAALTIVTAALGAFLLVAGPLLFLLGSLASLAAAFSIGLLPLIGIIGAIVIGIGALIAVGTLLVMNWDTVKEKLGDILSKIKDFFTNTWNNIKSFMSSVVDAIRNHIQNRFGWLLAFFEFIWSIITSIFRVGLAIVKAIWEFAWNQIVEFAKEIWGIISAVVGGGLTIIKAFVQTQLEDLRAIWESVWGTFGPFVTNIFQGIKTGVKGMVNFVIRMVNKLINGVNRVSGVLNKLPNVDISRLPNIPQLAEGGIVTKPTLAMIGEAGPEAVIPLDRKSAGTGTVINVTVNGDITGQELIEKVTQGIVKKFAINQRIPT